ncbi:unnamed protein product [marine sediment metagenome]|uniref:Histidine kinase N-terminal 7TM region domain-containing protein n=1 Tax=marine sediment metagenome TaxID=412755 RepID=X0RWI4_9ZZZZ
MLTVFGWIDGITASGVVIFGFIFGFFFLYKASKSGAKILKILGFVNILAGLMYLGVFTDFLVVLATETNLDNSNGLVGILSYIWFAPVMILALYIGAELLFPKRKWYLMAIIIIICIVFVILFFMAPMDTFNFVPPLVPGESLIDYNVILIAPAGIIMAILLLAVLIVLGFGFLIKSIQSSGVLRKKFLFLSLGAICFCIFGLLEGLTAPGDILMVIIVRIGYLISFWLMYYGLKD